MCFPIRSTWIVRAATKADILLNLTILLSIIAYALRALHQYSSFVGQVEIDMATVFTDSGDSKAASTIASETPKPPDEDGKSGDKSAGTDVKSEVDTTPQPSTQAESVAQDDKQTKTAEIPGSDSAAPSAAKVSDGGESVPGKSSSRSLVDCLVTIH